MVLSCLIYEIKINEEKEDFYEDKILFNVSDYLKILDFMILFNKKVLGKMKGEVRGNIANKFPGLKSKMYILVTAESKKITKAKAINKKVVERIRHKEYVEMLFGRGLMRHNMKRINSKLHRIRTYDICKISLSCFDDKGHVLDYGVNSSAYFYRNVLS